MKYELTDIKKIRKQSDLTQSELSKLSNVSQSIIAKIESGRVDPSYSTAKKIMKALEDYSSKDRLIAKDLMIKNIIYAKPQDKIHNIVLIMKKHSISQMPVIEDHKIIGLISEKNILYSDKENIVKEIMEDSPPTVPINTDVKVLIDMLKIFPLIIVSDKGKPQGIITKSDIIKKLY